MSNFFLTTAVTGLKIMSMAGYTKLFNSILASTIWRSNDKTRIVWITLLAMADKDGICEGSIPGLADLSRVSIEDCEMALDELSSPDTYSRTSDNEGRRIEAIDGVGWRLLNHAKYRAKMSEDERREYNRNKQAEWRAKQKESVTDSQDASMTVNDSQSLSAMSAHTEADTETKPDNKEDICRVVFDAWSQVMKRPKAKYDLKRKKRIQARLSEGFTVEDLKQVPYGAAKSAWHMGENPTNTKYDDIDTIYRDATQVEKFLALARNGHGNQSEGCDICRNHPNRSHISLKTYGWIFNTETKQLEDCICKNGTA